MLQQITLSPCHATLQLTICLSTTRWRRLDHIATKKRIPGDYKFLCSDGIGQRQMEWERKFQACTCQFAAHYFFASRETLRCFLTNVASALDEGGHFFGTIPDGKQILNVLRGQDLYDSGRSLG